MLFAAERIKYQDTNKFSKIVTDYLNGERYLKSFYNAGPSLEGLQEIIRQKQQQKTDRATLAAVLQEQYSNIPTSVAVQQNIASLTAPDTFTICTAHQPNLFTGPLYFIYKILHAIKLAAWLKEQLPQYKFVPVYYMGSEDADLDELNHTFLQGKKYTWNTKQSGAVGRMEIDDQLLHLVQEMKGQLLVQPYGAELVGMLEACYRKGENIQSATFGLVHQLFGKYGLIVLIPDHPRLKQIMHAVFEDDLIRQQPSKIVTETCERLSVHCDVQANPREINLFYLKDNIRARIVPAKEGYAVHDTDIRFTRDELLAELKEHPERFSPNVILRGLFQETILPNIAFVGGGGELAYWLQLKDLFDHYNVVFPLLLLRNSFLVLEKKWNEVVAKMNISTPVLFKTELQVLNALLEQAGKKPVLNGQLKQLAALYETLKESAASVDQSLLQHVEALKVKAVNRLQELEKKMQRAERKKHDALHTQVRNIRQQLFPGEGLQERRENFSSFYAKWGSRFIDELYQHSLTLEQEFVVLREI